MHHARYLILLMLFSAVASLATASSHAPMDGYQGSHDITHALVNVQEHEGDEPDAILSKALANTKVQPDLSLGQPQVQASSNGYRDYHCRAPPQFL